MVLCNKVSRSRDALLNWAPGPLGKIAGVGPYYRGMSNPLHPTRMTPAERLAELGRILAAGLIRMKARQSSGLSADCGESSVDLLRLKSGHATPTQRRNA
jgi:hypothetical protein